MKWIYALVLLPTLAHAEQSSVLCKTTDTNEFIDIVAKGSFTDEVLVQVSGGKFFDGTSKFENPVFKVFVEFENGKMALIYNVKTQDGAVGMLIGEEKQLHNIICKFRG